MNHPGIVKKLISFSILTLFAGICVWGQFIEGAEQAVGADSTLVDSTAVDSAALADTVVIPPDSMVLIPGGEYIIGYNKGKFDQKPEHKVKLRPFYIDIHEVTNAQFAEFLEATGRRLPLYWEDSTYNRPHLPVTGVSWDDAVAYCQWAGKRLPTEAEWEVAARGGLEREKYPWDGKIGADKANYRYDLDEDPEGIKPVGQYPLNGYGLYDMAGNVWEWTADYYSPIAYADTSDWDNPQGPRKGTTRVIRGGAWNYGEDYLQCAYRNRARSDMRFNYLGFRCANDGE